MSLLQELLGQNQSDQAVDQISQQVGADPSAVHSAIESALPMLLNGLAAKAATPDGSADLNSALEQHDGSILNNLGGLAGMVFGGGQGATTPQADGGGILGHIFGAAQTQVAQDVSNKTGLGTGQVAQILMMLAPIVMGYLGQQKQQQGLDAGGVSSLLGGLIGSVGGGGSWMNMAESALDRDRDGSAVDDIASMAMNYFRNK